MSESGEQGGVPTFTSYKDEHNVCAACGTIGLGSTPVWRKGWATGFGRPQGEAQAVKH